MNTATQISLRSLGTIGRYPEPSIDGERFTLLVPFSELPPGIPDNPNLRSPQLGRQLYRDIEVETLEKPHQFSGKSQGIHILAGNGRVQGSKLILDFFEEFHGIPSGGHTYALIQRMKDEAIRSAHTQGVSEPCVPVTVLVGNGKLKASWVDLVEGLSSTRSITKATFDNARGDLDWIKETLPEFNIAYRMGDPGYSVEDVLKAAVMFSDIYERTDSSIIPYSVSRKALDPCLSSVRASAPILKEILILRDIIAAEAPELYRHVGGKPGSLKWIRPLKGDHQFTFLQGRSTRYGLTDGVINPMLAAFRQFIVDTPKGMQWCMPFPAIIDLYRSIGGKMMAATKKALSDSSGGSLKIEVLRSNTSHWAYLYMLAGQEANKPKL